MRGSLNFLLLLPALGWMSSTLFSTERGSATSENAGGGAPEHVSK